MQIPPFMQRDSPVALHTATSISQNAPSNKIDAKWRFSVPVRTSDTDSGGCERCTFLLIKYYIVMGMVWDSIVHWYSDLLQAPWSGDQIPVGQDFLHMSKLS